MSEWTIKKALEWTEGYLADKGDENPRLSAQWLLSEACGLSRTQLFVNFDRPLSEDERGVLRDYVRRRGAGEPLQYITGEVAFRHINVKVRPGVLIPRPETEVLVSEVLAALPTPGPRDVAWNPEAAEQERRRQQPLPEFRHRPGLLQRQDAEHEEKGEDDRDPAAAGHDPLMDMTAAGLVHIAEARQQADRKKREERGEHRRRSRIHDPIRIVLKKFQHRQTLAFR